MGETLIPQPRTPRMGEGGQRNFKFLSIFGRGIEGEGFLGD